MKNIDIVKVAKVGGMVMSIAGTIITGWANSENTKRVLEKLVDAKLSNH